MNNQNKQKGSRLYYWGVNPFQFSKNRYQPEPDYIYYDNSHLWSQQKRSAFLIGIVAFMLPILMFLASQLSKPLGGMDVCFHESLSHFYYEQFWGEVFVGSLVFVGLYLFTYQGQCRAEANLATITGVFALGIALFPTSGMGCEMATGELRLFVDFTNSGCNGIKDVMTCVLNHVQNIKDVDALFLQFPSSGTVHLISAFIFMFCLLLHIAFVFTRWTKEDQSTEHNRQMKRRRNKLYKILSAIISATFIWAILARLNLLPSFIPTLFNFTFIIEAIILISFGIGWMLKGRFGTFHFIEIIGEYFMGHHERERFKA